MKKPKSVTPFRSRSAVVHNLAPLVEQVRTLAQSARHAAATSVNTFQERSPQIWQKPSGKLALAQKSQKPSGKLPTARIRQTASGKSPARIAQKVSAQLPSTTPSPFELTLPKNANIFASQYQLYLPSKEDLKQRLIEWTEEITDDA
jgi:hypothetical protein